MGVPPETIPVGSRTRKASGAALRQFRIRTALAVFKGRACGWDRRSRKPSKKYRCGDQRLDQRTRDVQADTQAVGEADLHGGSFLSYGSDAIAALAKTKVYLRKCAAEQKPRELAPSGREKPGAEQTGPSVKRFGLRFGSVFLIWWDAAGVRISCSGDVHRAVAEKSVFSSRRPFGERSLHRN